MRVTRHMVTSPWTGSGLRAMELLVLVTPSVSALSFGRLVPTANHPPPGALGTAIASVDLLCLLVSLFCTPPKSQSWQHPSAAHVNAQPENVSENVTCSSIKGEMLTVRGFFSSLTLERQECFCIGLNT